MKDSDGLIFAYLLDGVGGGRELSWSDITRGQDGCVWVHLERLGSVGRKWVENEGGVDQVVADTLYGEPGISLARWLQDSHPHIISYKNGLAVHLRGINLNPDADPNDMVSIRAWIDPKRIITVRERKIWAVHDIRDNIQKGTGPNGPAAFLDMLIRRLVDRIAEALVDLNDATDKIEDKMITRIGSRRRGQLADLRRRAIAKRRHLVPQREALQNLSTISLEWISDSDRARVMRSAERLARQVEDVENIRERTAIMQDEILNHLAIQSNRTMYILAVVATIFLPISFLTGLFGMNLGGIPGENAPWAFAIGCGAIAMVTLVEIWLFRRLKWF